MDREARRIAKSWGWKLEDLMDALENGGSSMNPVANISAAQAAHAIIQVALRGVRP